MMESPMREEASLLSRISAELAEMVERTAPSILRLNARRRNPASGIAWGADGLILTADHILEREEEITVGLASGEEMTASIVGRDPGADIALLRVGAQGLPLLAASAPPRVGQLVLAVARPSAGGPMASLGVVSSLRRAGRGWRGGGPGGAFIHTDVVLYPGFSGGPLVDMEGRLMGMNTARFGQGASLAIPLERAYQVAQALLSQGGARRGYLGVACQSVALPTPLRQRLQTQQEIGLLVVGVEPDGPAERGGVLLGDLLLALDEEPLEDTEGLQRLLASRPAGTTAVLRAVRAGGPWEVTITVGERE